MPQQGARLWVNVLRRRNERCPRRDERSVGEVDAEAPTSSRAFL